MFKRGCVAAGIVGIVMLVAGAVCAQSQPVPPGTVITVQNWRQYQQFMPAGLQAIFSGTAPFKFEPGFRMVIGQTHHYRWPTYEQNTEKYASRVKIVALPDGGHSLSGYVAGLPFPKPNSPLKGWKVLVNTWYRPLPWLECEPMWYLYLRDRFGNEHITGGALSYRRLSHISDPVKPITDPAAQGIDYSELLIIMLPEEAKYTAQLTLYYDNPLKPEDLFVFIPALRRSLRLSNASRCSPVAGSDLVQDDVHTGWNGGFVRWTVKFLRAGWTPSMVRIDPNVYGKRSNYDDILFPEPSIGSWEMRPVNIIDVRRVPSQRAGYCYGKRIMWVDSETWANLWADLYDAGMKYWKLQMINHPGLQIPGIGYTTDSGNFMEMGWDFQTVHISAAVSAQPDGEAVRANDQCKNYDGVNYTVVDRYNTVQALSRIMR